MPTQNNTDSVRIQISLEPVLDHMLTALVNEGGFGSNKSDVITKILMDYRFKKYLEHISRSEMINQATAARL